MTKPQGALRNRIAVITGAAGGIGSAVARAYAEQGGRLALVDRSVELLAPIQEELARGGHEVLPIAVDLRDEASVQSAFRKIREQLGEPDILVNNAGIDTTSRLVDMPTQMWDEMMAVNLRSVFLTTREVLPGMIARKWGRIINTASQLGHKGAADMVHYCAAKAGVIGFTRALAYEVAASGVTVNAVCPGPIDTPLLQALPQAWLDKKRAELPIGRFGRVEEVAPAFVLLASEQGSYFIGSTVNMNGGDYMI
ncbi:3-oxoacyl-[acyl-carrier protein] reductase [Enhydrobacter aerosaccus]|uniref:3-oxoacyl-[acyl-carrier protein] reductase n=1 Tax=Enhydrobacter aerosaccus TaxID=225324 RepID=A0A1T4JKQ8_9HYPH|nr:SDR family NAD(P)-dependent oxidoreductase [Enhydrobacter aerosaccus]SJZ30732.1 3-oxoacyl-[acyl-carrier protein] reductase [Enhydrobacter aerosaccus]